MQHNPFAKDFDIGFGMNKLFFVGFFQDFEGRRENPTKRREGSGIVQFTCLNGYINEGACEIISFE